MHVVMTQCCTGCGTAVEDVPRYLGVAGALAVWLAGCDIRATATILTAHAIAALSTSTNHSSNINLSTTSADIIITYRNNNSNKTYEMFKKQTKNHMHNGHVIT